MGKDSIYKPEMQILPPIGGLFVQLMPPITPGPNAVPDFTYYIAQGKLVDKRAMTLATDLYAGGGPWKNDPAAVARQGEGPLPPGHYRIGYPRHSAHLGPYVLDLIQLTGETFNRSLFRIHGDNRTHDASRGCIIAPHWVRERVNQDCGSERLLLVVP